MSECYDPLALVAVSGQTLRGCARQLDIDPAMFYRPWSEIQADRYATRLALHPGQVWPEWWDSIELPELPRSPCWRQLAATRMACLDGSARSIRRAALLTVAEAAAAIDVLPSRLAQWERGATRPTGAAGERYAALLAELAAVAAEHRARLATDGQQPVATMQPRCNGPRTPPSSAPKR